MIDRTQRSPADYIALPSGRTIALHGSRAIPTTGTRGMTVREWAEFCEVIRRRSAESVRRGRKG